MICIFWVKQVKYRQKLTDLTVTDSAYTLMLENLPKDATYAQIIDFLKSAGLSEHKIVYINRCYKFNHIWNLKRKEIYWLEKLKHLEAFRERRKQEGVENYDILYPSTKIISLKPFIRFPREELIKEKLEEVVSKFQLDEYKTMMYSDVAFVVLNNQNEVDLLREHFYVNPIKEIIWRY